jgi:hypothetical protein
VADVPSGLTISLTPPQETEGTAVTYASATVSKYCPMYVFLFRVVNNKVLTKVPQVGSITAVAMIYISWDITPCSQLKVNRLFGRT